MADGFSVIYSSIRARIRGGTQGGLETLVDANQAGQLVTADGMPRYTEASRRYAYLQVQTSTLFAPLTAVPTTTAALELWVNTSSQRTMVVESLFADQILGTAAAQAYAIYACVSVAKAVPSLTALSIRSVNGDHDAITPTVGSEVVTGVGTTVVANGWRPYGFSTGSALEAATPMHSWEAPIDGRLIVRPGRSLQLHITGSLTTASSFQVGAQFYMVPNTELQQG